MMGDEDGFGTGLCLECGLPSRSGTRCMCGVTVLSEGLRTVCRADDWTETGSGLVGESREFRVPEGLLLVLAWEES